MLSTVKGVTEEPGVSVSPQRRAHRLHTHLHDRCKEPFRINVVLRSHTYTSVHYLPTIRSCLSTNRLTGGKKEELDTRSAAEHESDHQGEQAEDQPRRTGTWI